MSYCFVFHFLDTFLVPVSGTSYVSDVRTLASRVKLSGFSGLPISCGQLRKKDNAMAHLPTSFRDYRHQPARRKPPNLKLKYLLRLGATFQYQTSRLWKFR